MGLALLATMSGAAATPAASAEVIHDIQPDLIARPSAEQLNRAYPREAQLRDVEGKVELQCKLARSGALEGCAALVEDPPGFGFAAAAQRLAPRFRARTPAALGLPEGEGVSLWLNFYLPRNPGSARADPIMLSAPGFTGRADVSCQVFIGRFDNCFVVKAHPANLEPVALEAAAKMSVGSLPLGLRMVLPMTFAPPP